ncbi:MAG: hypothetical protein NC200_07340 [Candidatus Gastranaerophilales bacterium]|nr:hypothetical protein [Candidatus Gastranaerophilales bacterium]
MGYFNALRQHISSATDIISLKQLKTRARRICFGGETDTFIRTTENTPPQKLQQVLGKFDAYQDAEKKFYTELYSRGSEKFDYVYQHFQGNVPLFNEEAFLTAIKDMPDKEVKKTFEEISNFYKSLPENIDNNYLEMVNTAQLTILKKHNKEAFEYIINNPDKESMNSLLGTFREQLNGSTFETLTIPQIRQLQGNGKTFSLNPRHNLEDRNILIRGLQAERIYVESSDAFGTQPALIENLNKYLSTQTITEPFTAFRAEKDTGMFDSIILDKSMKRKVKLLVLKNMFKARKIKVHDYNGTYQNFKHTDLFTHIMGRSELTLADAMQTAKYGDNRFRTQLVELIKNAQIQDSRFKSVTFDRGFAMEWVGTQDGHTKILQNIKVNKGIHGGKSNVDNKQAEYILNNDNKIISFQDVKYNPEQDMFYIDSTINPA